MNSTDASYSATKFALRGFAEALHMESRAYNVLVSLSLPPDVNTPTYTAEQLVKPNACKLISAGSGLYEPDIIANSIINNLLSYEFMFSNGLDGWIVTQLNTGCSPHTSILYAYIQLFGLGIMRAIYIAYRYMHNNICVQEEKLTRKSVH